MKTVLLTGATRGLGLAMARALDEVTDVHLVLAVRDVVAGEALARTLRRPARVVGLDLANMGSVMRLVHTWNEPLHALVNNAGLQLVGPTVHTEDGLEATFAVNHLAPTWLALGLLPWLRGGRVIGVRRVSWPFDACVGRRARPRARARRARRDDRVHAAAVAPPRRAVSAACRRRSRSRRARAA